MEFSNYRGVSLLNTAYKILSNILFARISPFAENVIGNYVYVPFSPFSFFRVPLNVLFRTPGGTHTLGWESLV